MHYYAASADQPLLLASSNGFGFIAKLGDMVSRVKAGKSFMTIDEGATPLAPMPVVPDATHIACLSSGGRLLVFGIDEMKTLSGGGRGVTLMALDAKETLRQALAIDASGVLMIGTRSRRQARAKRSCSGARSNRTSANARARAARRIQTTRRWASCGRSFEG